VNDNLRSDSPDMDRVSRLEWVRIYYRIYGVRSVRLPADRAASIKSQLLEATGAGWPEETSLHVSTDSESFGVRVADVAAIIFRPDVGSPRFDGFRRWWFDFESGCRANGIVSNEQWAAFDKAARDAGKTDRLLHMVAGSHDVFVAADQLASWRAVSDSYGTGYDFEDDDQNYRGGERGGYRGDRRGGNRYAGVAHGSGYGRGYGGGPRRDNNWDRR
jgi:hypothetical protein